MTGSAADAEDLVQDAWIRYLDAGAPEVRSLGAYLTTTVSRLALDYLKSARVKREEYIGAWLPEPVLTSEALPGPADAVEQRESVSMALLMLMEALTPEQRVVYVLREGFGLSFDEIAEHIGKPAATCRQVHRRARLRIDDRQRPSVAPGPEHRAILEQFLAAFEQGKVDDLAALLSDEVIWYGDGGAERRAIRRPVVGPERVSRGLTKAAIKFAPDGLGRIEIADLNGAPAAIIWTEEGIDSVTTLDIVDGRIVAVRSMRNLTKLRHLEASAVPR
jgi:RNA polymerase sigma-70 factor (ECF subfamily)